MKLEAETMEKTRTNCAHGNFRLELAAATDNKGESTGFSLVRCGICNEAISSLVFHSVFESLGVRIGDIEKAVKNLKSSG